MCVMWPELAFGSKAVGYSYTKTVYMVNTGLLPSHFMISHNLPSELQIRPIAGLVPPKGYLPLYIKFSPVTSSNTKATLRLLTSSTVDNNYNPPSASGKVSPAVSLSASASAGSSDGAVEHAALKVTGSGGTAEIGIQFFSELDRQVNY